MISKPMFNLEHPPQGCHLNYTKIQTKCLHAIKRMESSQQNVATGGGGGSHIFSGIPPAGMMQSRRSHQSRKPKPCKKNGSRHNVPASPVIATPGSQKFAEASASPSVGGTPGGGYEDSNTNKNLARAGGTSLFGTVLSNAKGKIFSQSTPLTESMTQHQEEENDEDTCDASLVGDSSSDEEEIVTFQHND